MIAGQSKTDPSLTFKLVLMLTALIYLSVPVRAQEQKQVLKGFITDSESRVPLQGANVFFKKGNQTGGTVTDEKGQFTVEVPLGRLSVEISFIGYEPAVFSDILVGSGKEVEISAGLREKYNSTSEVVVTATRNIRETVNPMSTVSTHTVRTEDALRFAGGFYDPSRIVNGFAGVVTANSDESNDIVIRGNSSRGLLWRLEGIEIPNPNHFGDGQGGSGGAYSAITSNVISSFDFLTGAFPAEYGNAASGVMDLNLRKGNSSKNEFAFQTGMIGLEGAAEGPLKAAINSSFLVNVRYVNFGYLEKLGIIDLGSTNFAPRSGDLIFNFSFSGKENSSINIFGFYGNSAIGKKAIRDYTKWTSSSDRWEEIEEQSSTAAGIKYLRPLKDGSGYIRAVAAYTGFTDNYSEGEVDSAYVRTNSYHHSYSYPGVRFSFLLNNKISTNNTVRTGINLHFLGAAMEQWRSKEAGKRENLVEPSAFGLLYQFYVQFKSRISPRLDFNAGVHSMVYSINKDLSLEPRLGLKWRVSKNFSVDAGAGLHSRIEAMPVYFNLIRDSKGKYRVMNDDLEFSRSFQQVLGFDWGISENTRLRVEAYNQLLTSVPVTDDPNSTYSSINTSEELPASDLVNKGRGYNRGLEFTLERKFSNNYYFLATASLFDSKYRPSDGKLYNTYYNNNYVANLIAGKDILIGSSGKNILGINIKSVYRGGYRFTPVDYVKSAAAGRVVYLSGATFGIRLPDFLRIDGGISFRKNLKSSSWILMADVQNLTGRRNVFRRKYSFKDGSVTENNIFSLGAVPVANFRIEF